MASKKGAVYFWSLSAVYFLDGLGRSAQVNCQNQAENTADRTILETLKTTRIRRAASYEAASRTLAHDRLSLLYHTLSTSPNYVH